MRNILLLSILTICLLLTQSCKFEKSNNTSDKKETEESQKQKSYEAIKKQLNTVENCIIFDSTQVFKSIEDILELKRFDGKVVYLDFWETGCKPCIEEFSYLPDLKKKFKNKPIEYLYVVTYREKESKTYKEKVWRRLIEKHKLTGVNLLISKDAKQRFYARHRNIVDPKWADMVPVYLLFNKQGEVANYVAPRPSSKKTLYAEIQGLLDEE